MHTLTSKLERGTKALQFDVCCKAIDQNFDCGCTIMQFCIYIIWSYIMNNILLEMCLSGPPKLCAPPTE